jgi:hypothetical protein
MEAIATISLVILLTQHSQRVLRQSIIAINPGTIPADQTANQYEQQKFPVGLKNFFTVLRNESETTVIKTLSSHSNTVWHLLKETPP